MRSSDRRSRGSSKKRASHDEAARADFWLMTRDGQASDLQRL